MPPTLKPPPAAPILDIVGNGVFSHSMTRAPGPLRPLSPRPPSSRAARAPPGRRRSNSRRRIDRPPRRAGYRFLKRWRLNLRGPHRRPRPAPHVARLFAGRSDLQRRSGSAAAAAPPRRADRRARRAGRGDPGRRRLQRRFADRARSEGARRRALSLHPPVAQFRPPGRHHHRHGARRRPGGDRHGRRPAGPARGRARHGRQMEAGRPGRLRRAADARRREPVQALHRRSVLSPARPA